VHSHVSRVMNPIEGGVAQENVALGYFKQNKQNVAVVKQMRDVALGPAPLSARAALRDSDVLLRAAELALHALTARTQSVHLQILHSPLQAHLDHLDPYSVHFTRTSPCTSHAVRTSASCAEPLVRLGTL
jgi:hypothetical protein